VLANLIALSQKASIRSGVAPIEKCILILIASSLSSSLMNLATKTLSDIKKNQATSKWNVPMSHLERVESGDVVVGSDFESKYKELLREMEVG
jgi:hypothetical protein